MTAADKINALLSRLETRHGIKVTQAAIARAYRCGSGPMSQFLKGVRPIPDLPRLLAAISACLPPGWSVHMGRKFTAAGGEILDDSLHIYALPPEEE